MMLKGSIHGRGKTKLNMYALINRVSKYIKQYMSKMKEQTLINYLQKVRI